MWSLMDEHIYEYTVYVYAHIPVWNFPKFSIEKKIVFVTHYWPEDFSRKVCVVVHFQIYLYIMCKLKRKCY